jgi:hypothetical protein
MTHDKTFWRKKKKEKKKEKDYSTYIILPIFLQNSNSQQNFAPIYYKGKC